jgi:hypothetical protein
VLRAAGLGARRVTAVTRLRGGSKKGVYRLTCADGFSAILYVWAGEEDYWPADPDQDQTHGAGAGVFAHASGLELFEGAASRLSAAGVRVPRVYLADRGQAAYPADIALVEDVRGGTLEELLETSPADAAPVMERLGDMLSSMWRERAAHVGKAAAAGSARSAGGPDGPRSEQIVLDRALRHLDRAARRVPRLADVRARLEETARALAAAIPPRAEYTLIHGELGPDHVLLDKRRRPVLIDIEGAMYFDAEWEHVFLRLRFGRAYRWLRASGLDERRMRLHALAMDLSLIDGPLRLLDGGFPDREEMLAIVAHAVDRAIAAAAS